MADRSQSIRNNISNSAVNLQESSARLHALVGELSAEVLGVANQNSKTGSGSGSHGAESPTAESFEHDQEYKKAA